MAESQKPKKRTWRQILWTTFSEADERYLDLARVGYALGLLSFVGLAFTAAVRDQPWDPVAFGTGFAALLFGGGVGVGLRAKLEDGTGAGSQETTSTGTTGDPPA